MFLSKSSAIQATSHFESDSKFMRSEFNRFDKAISGKTGQFIYEKFFKLSENPIFSPYQEHKYKYSFCYNQKIHNSAQLIIFFTKSWTYFNCKSWIYPSHCNRNASSAISIKCGNHKSKRINYKKCANVSGEEKILAIKKYNLTNKKKKEMKIK